MPTTTSGHTARIPKQRAAISPRTEEAPPPPQGTSPTTQELPTVAASTASTPPAGLVRPSPALVAGAAALMVAAAGAVNVGSAQASERTLANGEESQPPTHRAAGFGSDTDRLRGSNTVINSDGGGVTISRSSAREPIDNAAAEEATGKAVAKRAAARDAALDKLAALANERAEELKSKQWVLPVDSYRLTATFGEGGGLWSSDHTGLDFAAPYGTPIKSVGHGIVTSASYEGAYGNQTTITHSDGTQTTYSHQASSTVSTGEEVDAGEVIGYIGMTGNTTGPHLHFEVLTDPETPVDPYGVLVEHGLNP